MKNNEKFVIIGLINTIVWMLLGILAMHLAVFEIALIAFIMTTLGITLFAVTLMRE